MYSYIVGKIEISIYGRIWRHQSVSFHQIFEVLTRFSNFLYPLLLSTTKIALTLLTDLMRLTIAYNSNHLHLSLSGRDIPYSEQQDHVGTRDFFRFFVVASCSIFLSHGVTEINNKSSIFVMYYLQIYNATSGST